MFAPSFLGISLIPTKYFDIGDLAKILKKAKNESNFKNGNKADLESEILTKSGKN